MNMRCSKDFFKTFNEFPCEQAISLPDGNMAYGIGSGNVMWKNSNLTDAEVRDVMLVPSFNQNLVSVKRMVEKGCEVTFDQDGLKVILEGDVVATRKLEKINLGALYELDGESCMYEQQNFANSVKVKNKVTDITDLVMLM